MQIGSIDTEQIVTSLLQIEQRPLFALQARQDSATDAVNAIGRVRTGVESFRLAATRLADISAFSRFKTSVSQPDAISASVSGTAFSSSISFTVDQLAQSHGLRSVGTVPSDSVPITNDALIAVASGTLGIGVDTVKAGAGLAAGSIAFEVTQSSAGASSVGSSPLAASTVIDGTNNTLNLTVNGSAQSVTLAAGTYDAAGLTQAVQDALDTAGVAAQATVDTTGALELTSTREGSLANLQVTGGNALSALGLGIDAAAHIGTDGIIDIGGTITTVTQAESGQAVAVDTGAGTLDINLSGGLRVGSSDVEVVSTGDRSLSDVAAAINGAGNGVAAAAVKVGTDTWRLQLSANETGLDGHIAIDGSAMSSIGGLVESSTAQNAQITIGAGAGAYSVEASGNTFNEVISGVTLTAKAVTSSAVTVGVERNDQSIADDVANLVSNANAVLAEIKVQTRYDSVTGSSGALAGNSAVRRMAQQIRDALGGQVDGVSGALPSTVGIQLTRDGSFTFDEATFLAASADDPTLVARLFGRGGTESGDAIFAGALDTTAAGDYDVVITTAASRATSALLFDGGAVADSRVGIRIGTVTATYDVTNGQSAAQIIDGLNEAIASAGLDVVAEIDGTGLNLRANDWGTGGDFELNVDVLGAGTWDIQAGNDVEGTIDGLVATGTGRQLALNPPADSVAAGLKIDIADGALGALGLVEYRPGIAARIVEVATRLADDDTGALSGVANAAERRVTEFGDQITRLEDRLVVREVNLRRQWSSLQTLLGGLQNQSAWINSQLSTLGNFNG